MKWKETDTIHLTNLLLHKCKEWFKKHLDQKWWCKADILRSWTHYQLLIKVFCWLRTLFYFSRLYIAQGTALHRWRGIFPPACGCLPFWWLTMCRSRRAAQQGVHHWQFTTILVSVPTVFCSMHCHPAMSSPTGQHTCCICVLCCFLYSNGRKPAHIKPSKIMQSFSVFI